jgi:hypothetical protein
MYNSDFVDGIVRVLLIMHTITNFVSLQDEVHSI